MSFKTCNSNPAHSYDAALEACPECAATAEGVGEGRSYPDFRLPDATVGVPSAPAASSASSTEESVSNAKSSEPKPLTPLFKDSSAEKISSPGKTQSKTVRLEYLPMRARLAMLGKTALIFALIWMLTPPLFHALSSVVTNFIPEKNNASSLYAALESGKKVVRNENRMGVLYGYLVNLTIAAWLLWNFNFNFAYSVGKSVKFGPDEEHFKNALRGTAWGALLAVSIMVFIAFAGTVSPMTWLIGPASITFGQAASLLWERRKTELDMEIPEIQIVKFFMVVSFAAVLVLSRF